METVEMGVRITTIAPTRLAATVIIMSVFLVANARPTALLIVTVILLESALLVGINFSHRQCFRFMVRFFQPFKGTERVLEMGPAMPGVTPTMIAITAFVEAASMGPAE